ncbi:MAG: trypsin-like peptidase domain-containing protein [Planctomycetaceae bacterium]|nr:trypsin-like peptidase domain-containing protein [Planctomycetaceae bacterium]
MSLLSNRLVIFVLVVILLPSCFVFGQDDNKLSDEPDEAAVDVASVQEMSRVFRAAANKVIPATLKIISHQIVSEPSNRPTTNLPEPDIRRFGDSTGTGVMIHPRGIIATNRHVINNGKEIEVELADGRRYNVTKFRDDEFTDLAVLWIKTDEDLPFARFGNSDRVNIGDWVLAIGNPFDLDLSVSTGIISARGRSNAKLKSGDFLQTDASINPGNSGGPLINVKGEVIGINTMIISQSGVNQGIGFAMPSNTVYWVLKQLVEKGKVERGWLGATTRPVTSSVAKRLGVQPKVGVMVIYSVPSSPAARSGLRPDDIIITIDNEPISTLVDYHRLEERAEPNKQHNVKIIRDGQERTLAITFVVRPPEAKSDPSQIAGAEIPRYVDKEAGISVLELPANVSEKLKLGGVKGMLIFDVLSGGTGEGAGLAKGMLIVKVDGKPTPDRDSFIRARQTGSIEEGIRFEYLIPNSKVPQAIILKK